MATGSFTSCTVDHTGRGVTIVFGAPTPNSWSASGSIVADAVPAIIVNGLSIPVTWIDSVGDTTLTVDARLEGVIHLNDVVVLTGNAGWIEDNSGVDDTGAMVAEDVTNNSKQLQDEV